MGLPALRRYPQLSPDASVDVHERSGAFTGHSQPGDAFDLSTVVEAVFDPIADRVIYEQPGNLEGDHRSHDGRFIARGTGLAAAVACADAFERLGTSQFVVVVIDSGDWERELAEELPNVAAIRRRLIVLAPSGGGVESGLAELAAAGWRITDLRGRSTARGIAKSLVAARYDQQSTVILLDAAVADAGLRAAIARQVCAQVPVAIAAPASDATAVLVKELQARVTVDPRLAPVVLVDDPVWQPLELAVARRGLASAKRRLERGLMIGGALSRSGCHPLIVAEEAALSAAPGVLARALSGHGFRGTLIVVGSDRNDRLPPAWPGNFEQHVLPTGFGAAEATRLVGACLQAERPAVLFVPSPRVVAVVPAVESGALPAERAIGPERFRERDGGRSLLSQTGIPFAVSSESAQSDQQEIEHKRLRLEVRRWVQDYDRVGHRNLYLWRWCLHGIELTTFPGVAEEHRTHLHDTKLLSVILCVLFDDVADRHGRTELLETLIQSAGGRGSGPAGDLDGAECEYLEVTQRLWLEYESRVRQYPQFPVYERLWRFDLLQFLNTMRYAHLVNSQPGLMNLTEHDVYTPHNMLMVSFSTLDLMCVAHFHTAELGSLREAMWHAQSMGRIGNVLSTWRRELSEADHSSGMFGDDSSLSMSSKEQLLLEKWRWHRSRCHAAAERVGSLDLRPVLSGHDRFFDMHLASAGRI